MLKKFLNLLFAVFFFASSFVFLCIQLVIFAFTAPFDPKRRACHYFACFWGSFYIMVNPWWRLTIKGREHIDPGKTYVFVSNHQSYWDIFSLYALYKPFKWVSKESIFKVPFVGQNMKLNQYVYIKRGDMKSIKEMMVTCRGWLDKGVSLLMFPEGTRSEDGEIQHFRDGAFRLAINCNVPVIPIVLDGTGKILSKDGKESSFVGDIKIEVLPPVSPDQFERSSGMMRNHVHKLMVDKLAEMRGVNNKTLEPTLKSE